MCPSTNENYMLLIIADCSTIPIPSYIRDQHAQYGYYFDELEYIYSDQGSDEDHPCVWVAAAAAASGSLDLSSLSLPRPLLSPPPAPPRPDPGRLLS
jgi:hypothetical protein